MISVGPGKMVEPGVVVYWFGADLYYANVSHFAEQARTLAAHGQGSVRWLVVDAGALRVWIALPTALSESSNRN